MSPMSPAESFRCGEHDAKLDEHDRRLGALEDDGADRERRLTTMDAEWRSRTRLVAQYIAPILLVVIFEAVKLLVFKR